MHSFFFIIEILLIAPEGIEINSCDFVLFDSLMLLIAPEGIEINRDLEEEKNM
jgi:hypothetical protein